VGQPNPEMVSVGCDEYLRLVPESPEGDGVDDTVAVALEDVAWAARTGAVFRMEAPA